MTLRVVVLFYIALVMTACGPNRLPEDYPEKLKELPIGLEVIHNTSEVYATINTKDPEKWGLYQLQFKTSVTALEEDLEIIEFGGYLWKDNLWELRSIYARPFNAEEFAKWYGCENGQLKKGVSYSDSDNWLGKGDVLNSVEIKCIWYFIAKNEGGEKFVGASELVGYMKLKQ